MRKAALALIKIYQATRPFRRPCCRFYPSCSSYLAGSIEKHGLLRGAILGVLRLVRCHPLHPGGVDEVPDEFLAPTMLPGMRGRNHSVAFAGAQDRRGACWQMIMCGSGGGRQAG